jgi:hypothetical protein
VNFTSQVDCPYSEIMKATAAGTPRMRRLEQCLANDFELPALARKAAAAQAGKASRG